MVYSQEQVTQLNRRALELGKEFQSLMLRGLSESEPIESMPVRHHIRHGSGRRLGIMGSALARVFRLFPPSRRRTLPREKLVEAEINLHAYTINLLGIFDNWAWAFLLRHGLVSAVGSRLNISLFKEETQELLPATFRTYLSSPPISTWHSEYAKGYRDALAHRIPLYIPPAVWLPADKQRYEELEAEKSACILAGRWEQLDKVWAQQDKIGKPSFYIQHAFSDNPKDRAVLLHAQMLCDGATVVDVGNRFYDCWHECSGTP